MGKVRRWGGAEVRRVDGTWDDGERIDESKKHEDGGECEADLYALHHHLFGLEGDAEEAGKWIYREGAAVRVAKGGDVEPHADAQSEADEHDDDGDEVDFVPDVREVRGERLLVHKLLPLLEDAA